MDGSFHDWYEGRGPRGCLMNMVDDASSETVARMGSEETIWAAAGVLRAWIQAHGIPVALYTDWKNVYLREASSKEQLEGVVPVTQFGRMCQSLGIRIIAANSPQAKGRVERNHGTHQDRLGKKMRQKKIQTDAEANRFLEKEYLPEHNRRFRRTPGSHGGIQGVIHSVFFGASPAYFQLRELSTGELMKCAYSSRKQYDELAVVLKQQNAVVHVYGTIKTDLINRQIEELRVDKMELADTFSKEDFDRFFV